MRYYYKSYEHSRLATAVDKFCHTPLRILSFFVPAILYAYWMLCADHLPVPSGIMDTLKSVAIAAMIICFIGSFFLGILCDKCRISERIALWDIRRKAAGGKLTARFRIILVLIVVLFAAPGAAALINYGLEQNAAADYHDLMCILDQDSAPEVGGNKIVARDMANGRYTIDFVPEELLAASPEEVRYILRYSEGAEEAGVYENSGVVGYRRTCTVELYDRMTGWVIATERFYGGNPPRSIDEGTTHSQYGSHPDAAEVTVWITERFE